MELFELMLQIHFTVQLSIVINAMLPSSFQGSLLLDIKKNNVFSFRG
jgi:hypothetical protein